MKPYFNNNEDSTVKYYNENAHDFINDTFNANMEHLYGPFLAEIPKGSKILDAGCGSGRDSLYFKQHGYEIVAFDASEKMVKLGSKLVGKPVFKLSFDEISFEEEFDGIWASASLIHIPKKRILPILAKLEKALKNTGILYASFKYGEGEKSIDGRFFNYYTEKTLEETFKKLTGLKPERIWKTADVRVDRKNEHWVNILAKKVVK